SFARVVFRYRLGLQFVGRQPVPNDVFAVIFSGHQRRTINIASISNFGWLGVDVVDPSTDGARTASSDTTQQLIIIHVNSDHNGQTLATLLVVKELVLQKRIQPSGLGRIARKTIKDKT